MRDETSASTQPLPASVLNNVIWDIVYSYSFFSLEDFERIASESDDGYHKERIQLFFSSSVLQQIVTAVEQNQLLWPIVLIKELLLTQANTGYYAQFKPLVIKKIESLKQKTGDSIPQSSLLTAVLCGLLRGDTTIEYKYNQDELALYRQNIVVTLEPEIEEKNLAPYSGALKTVIWGKENPNKTARLFLFALASQNIAISQILLILGIEDLFGKIRSLHTRYHAAYICLEQKNRMGWDQLLLYGQQFLVMLISQTGWIIGHDLVQDRYFYFLQRVQQIAPQLLNVQDSTGCNIAHDGVLQFHCTETRAHKSLAYLWTHQPDLFFKANAHGITPQQYAGSSFSKMIQFP